MNKAQKEVLQAQLDREKELIKDLKQVFGQAQDDVVNKIIDLSRRQDMENLQTIIYQMVEWFKEHEGYHVAEIEQSTQTDSAE